MNKRKKILVGLAAALTTVGGVGGAAHADAASCTVTPTFSDGPVNNGTQFYLSMFASAGCSDVNTSASFLVETANGDVAFGGSYNPFIGQSYSPPVPTVDGVYSVVWVDPNPLPFTAGSGNTLTIGTADPTPTPEPSPTPEPTSWATTGTLAVTSHRGTDVELSGSITTSDDLGGQTHPAGVLMDLERKDRDGSWQYIISGTTDKDGSVAFSGVNSYRAQYYRMVPRNRIMNGDYRTKEIHIGQSAKAPVHFGNVSASRRGTLVTVVGELTYRCVWVTAAPYAGTTLLARPLLHVHLQRLAGRTWRDVNIILTKPETADSIDLLDAVRYAHRTTFRWYYPGSSAYAAAVSGKVTK